MLLAHVFESKGKLRRGPESLRPLQVLAIFAVKVLTAKVAKNTQGAQS
jgi:hypothetical protein